MMAARSSITWTAPSDEDLADLVPALQMVRESVSFVSETAEVDDALQARRLGRRCEVSRRLPVLLLEVVPGHRVHEVVRDIDAVEDIRERRRIGDIGGDRLHLGVARRYGGRVTRRSTNLMTRF